MLSLTLNSYSKFMQAKINLSISLVLIFTFSVAAQDLTFEEYNPPSTLVVPGKEVKRAKFPFIDVHGHQFRMATQDLSELIKAMDTLNEASYNFV